jgi:hypothetical protein
VRQLIISPLIDLPTGSHKVHVSIIFSETFVLLTTTVRNLN